jgi:hypothetical protein
MGGVLPSEILRLAAPTARRVIGNWDFTPVNAFARLAGSRHP